MPETVTRYAAASDCLATQRWNDRGTLGVIGVDRITKLPVALTAMHVFPGIAEFPRLSGAEEVWVDAPCSNGRRVLGQLLRGTLYGIDAAAVGIVGQAPSNLIPGIGNILKWRQLSLRKDVGTRVRMRGARTDAVRYGRILEPSRPVPLLDLDAAIVVEIEALPGDSGAALVDDERNLLGLLVGGTSTRQYFCPIASIFNRLKCNLL